MVRHRMAYVGCEPSRQTLKYRCPALSQATKKLERLYKGRTSVERLNARLKVFWGADSVNVTGSRRFFALLGSSWSCMGRWRRCWRWPRTGKGPWDNGNCVRLPKRFTANSVRRLRLAAADDGRAGNDRGASALSVSARRRDRIAAGGSSRRRPHSGPTPRSCQNGRRWGGVGRGSAPVGPGSGAGAGWVRVAGRGVSLRQVVCCGDAGRWARGLLPMRDKRYGCADFGRRRSPYPRLPGGRSFPYPSRNPLRRPSNYGEKEGIH